MQVYSCIGAEVQRSSCFGAESVQRLRFFSSAGVNAHIIITKVQRCRCRGAGVLKGAPEVVQRYVGAMAMGTAAGTMAVAAAAAVAA